MNPSFSGATITLMLSTLVNQSLVSTFVVIFGSDKEMGAVTTGVFDTLIDDEVVVADG